MARRLKHSALLGCGDLLKPRVSACGFAPDTGAQCAGQSTKVETPRKRPVAGPCKIGSDVETVSNALARSDVKPTFIPRQISQDRENSTLIDSLFRVIAM